MESSVSGSMNLGDITSWGIVGRGGGFDGAWYGGEGRGKAPSHAREENPRHGNHDTVGEIGSE
ncbi:hypothetical protein E2C01_052503 [Portunus trituberculatus]|uniref:Uncharacterized protein n=1 Tax=Portunus trituberculatus TaxID=210409 RepID=A0A5B7GLQ3_PORTR|nr:hypothetical protein [Portunus trituberculatus]